MTCDADSGEGGNQDCNVWESVRLRLMRIFLVGYGAVLHCMPFL